LPQTACAVFSGAYVPGTRGTRLGGDWYDALERPDGDIAISIGDVEGHSVDAAFEMATIRAALFALQRVCLYPVTTLQHLDAFVERTYPDRFVTAFAARYDPTAHSLWYANAGHPAPFVRAASGALRRLALADVPLGVGSLHRRTLYTDELLAGDILVAFTDGLIEMTRDLDAGERRLAKAIADPAFVAAADPAAWLRETLVERFPLDDVAILTMRIVR
jgi:serine phosphatase RsbU (regulator of sigma subunit)